MENSGEITNTKLNVYGNPAMFPLRITFYGKYVVLLTPYRISYVILGDNGEAEIIDLGPKTSIENVVSALSSFEEIKRLKYIFGTTCTWIISVVEIPFLRNFSLQIYVHPKV